MRKLPMNKPSVRKLLLTYLPTFSWQTGAEILSMLEYVDENISEDALDNQLTKLHKLDVLERKQVRKTTGSRGVQVVFAYRKK